MCKRIKTFGDYVVLCKMGLVLAPLANFKREWRVR